MIADNFAFRVLFAVAGMVWNSLLAYGHLRLGRNVEESIAGASPPMPATLPHRLDLMLSLNLHHVAPALVVIVSVLLVALCVSLLIHAVQNMRDPDRLIAWPRKYWPVKIVLAGLLLGAVWLQYEVYVRLRADLFPWTDNYKNPGPDDRFESVVIAFVGCVPGLPPLLSCLDRREPIR